MDTLLYMPAKIAANVRLDAELLEGLRRVRERIGIPVSEQIRRAIRDWLKTQGSHHE